MHRFKLSSARFWAITITLTIALAGYGDSGQSTTVQTGQMPTDKECQGYAARVERAAREGDLNAFNATVDYDAMLESTTGGIDVAAAVRKQFVEGAKKGMNSDKGFASQLLKQVAAGGSFVFLRTADVNNQKRVRFRLLLASGGVNYHEWIVVRNSANQVKAVDIYAYATAELLSKTMRRMYLPFTVSQSRSVLSKLTRGESEFVKNIAKFGGMAAAVRSGNFSQVQSIYYGLPQSLKKDKTFLILRLQAASVSGNEAAYLAAIDDFRKFHPNDPCVTLFLIDHHTMKKEYTAALDCIKQLDKAVGGDPYLLTLQAGIYCRKGDTKTARKLALETIAAEPTLLAPYWTLIEVSITDKDFEETNRLFGQIEQNFTMEIGDLTRIPEYSEYVKSPQYKQWLKKHQPIQLPGLDGFDDK